MQIPLMLGWAITIHKSRGFGNDTSQAFDVEVK